MSPVVASNDLSPAARPRRARLLERIFDVNVESLPRRSGTLVLLFPLGQIAAGRLRQALARHGLPDRLVLASVTSCFDAHVPLAEQVRIVGNVPGLVLANLRFGIDDQPDVPRALSHASTPIEDASDLRFVVCDEERDMAPTDTWPGWRRWLFSLLARRSEPAARFFRIPAWRMEPAPCELTPP